MRCEECGLGISDKPYYQDGLAFCSQHCAEMANEMNINGDDYLMDNDDMIGDDVSEEFGLDSMLH